MRRAWNAATSFFSPLRQLAAIRRFTIPRAWLIAYLLLIVLPTGIFLYGYYERSADILKSEVVRTMQQALKQAGSNLSYRLERIEDISDAAFMNANLHSYLLINSDDQSIGTQIKVIEDLRYLVETVQSNSDVFRVRLFVDKSKLYAEERINFFTLDSLRNRSWFHSIIGGNGSIVWTGVYEESYLGAPDESILSAARMLRDPDDYAKVSGVLMIDIRQGIVSGILSELQFAPGTSVYLVDREGAVVYHPDAALIGTAVEPHMLDALNEGTEGTTSLLLNGEQSDVLYTTLSPTGWKLVAQGTKSQLSKATQLLTKRSEWRSLIEYIALFLILPFVLLAIIVRGMNRRVNHVITVIRKEGKEGKDGIDGLHDLPAVNGDFHMLERSVDHLILRVRTLVEENYTAEIREREAQLSALQAQINPHFLYNTLDTINWIAIGKGATDISAMIDSLAKYFRLSLNKGKNIVSVMDELKLAEVYLEIQQSRFLGSFDFNVAAGEGLERYRMPKLILQPIVENALLHGIRKAKDRKGRIDITVELEQGDLVFVISDNGIGMDEKLSRRLLTEERVVTDDHTGTGSSYGLFNVNERIKLYAGEGYGLSIASQVGVGTSVTVRMRAEVAASRNSNDTGD
ncbi:histidine kinase [Paenibacillus sp. FSL H8-0548]|uniref:cache domain-containing sensor histidine kinase n=1 Tax=Paenibacillus sp. FSL H8-0548 TaxID=1920422 RepID=UPI00096E89EF|nr:sensor histidine kinase [Paenibacillus sp. FSL H8-0548]OMF34539.1 histidine kinase [Paenibacillus sp. FSL H8-0548]